jgi:hypothetical protein
MRATHRKCHDRRGAAVVEFAIVVPVFFVLVFGMIEYGRMVMVQQMCPSGKPERFVPASGGGRRSRARG